MSEGHQHNERDRSPDESARASESGHININRFSEQSRLIPWLMLACLLSGFALAMAVMTLIVYSQNYRELERENRLMQQKYDDMKVEFLSRGMNPHPHMPGETK